MTFGFLDSTAHHCTAFGFLYFSVRSTDTELSSRHERAGVRYFKRVDKNSKGKPLSCHTVRRRTGNFKYTFK
jgi:hypothetical protein